MLKYALSFLATAVFAQAPLPPAIPWNGKSHELIAGPDNKWITVAEKTAFRATPTYEQYGSPPHGATSSSC
jgi:hypothetical protein